MGRVCVGCLRLAVGRKDWIRAEFDRFASVYLEGVSEEDWWSEEWLLDAIRRGHAD